MSEPLSAKDELVTRSYLDEKLEAFVTKGYLDFRFEAFEEKFDEKMQKQTATVLQAIDTVLSRFDTAEKDRAAHDALHHRITDDLHGYGERLKKLEAAPG